MKINNKILSIPPHISTCWSHISALHMKGMTLIVNLLDGEAIEIPNLDVSTIETIFNTHADFIERHPSDAPQLNMMHPFAGNLQTQPLEAPFRLTINTLDELGSVLHHNPSQANTPTIPKEILEKIILVTKIIAPEDITLPKAEPHCNCTHCQIARALGQAEEPPLEVAALAPKQKGLEKEEVISDKDLKFQQWEIQPSGSQLYTVINRLDPHEKYSVYLGEPVGCTCGKAGCEHIISVLKS